MLLYLWSRHSVFPPCAGLFWTHHLKENKRRTQRASLLFPAVFNAKGHIQTKLSTFRAWSFPPYIYYKFALGTKPIKWSCPAGTAHWMFTLKQNNCPLSFHHMSLPCWMIVVPLSLPVAIQCTVSSANGGIPWWRVWTVFPVRLQHVATATANITACHKLLHMCGILLC